MCSWKSWFHRLEAAALTPFSRLCARLRREGLALLRFYGGCPWALLDVCIQRVIQWNYLSQPCPMLSYPTPDGFSQNLFFLKVIPKVLRVVGGRSLVDWFWFNALFRAHELVPLFVLLRMHVREDFPPHLHLIFQHPLAVVSQGERWHLRRGCFCDYFRQCSREKVYHYVLPG